MMFSRLLGRVLVYRHSAVVTGLFLAAGLAMAALVWAAKPPPPPPPPPPAQRPAYEAPPVGTVPWPKHAHDLRNSGQSPYPGPILQPAPAFITTRTLPNGMTVPDGAGNAVVDADGRIYADGEHGLSCFNADGTQAWHIGCTKDGSTSDPYAQPYNVPGNYYPDQQLPCDSAGPTLGANGTIFVAGSAGRPSTGGGHVSAINPRDPSDPTGETLLPINANGFLSQDAQLWTFLPEDSNFESRSPVFVPDELGGGTVYAVTLHGTLYAFDADPQSGDTPQERANVRWSLALGGIVDYVAAEGNGSMVAVDTEAPDGTRTVYVGGKGALYAVQDQGTSGSLKWTVALGTNARPTNPVVSLDHTIYVSTDDSNLRAIAANGAVQWKVKMTQAGAPKGGFAFTPTIGGVALDEFYDANTGALATTIYVGVYRGIQAFRPDGTVKWKFEDSTKGVKVDNPPAIGADGIIYATGRGGGTMALRDTGEWLWK